MHDSNIILSWVSSCNPAHQKTKNSGTPYLNKTEFCSAYKRQQLCLIDIWHLLNLPFAKFAIWQIRQGAKFVSC